MKLNRTASITAAIVLVITGVNAFADVPGINNYTLSNGIQVVFVQIKDSNNLNIFSFIPLGMALDGPGQTQWAHLAEHLILRTAIPLDYSKANAETMQDWMHLDYYGTMDELSEGLSYQAKCLQNLRFPEATFEKEKQSLIQETENIARNRVTHKLAFAAWAQAVRHNSKHAAIIGDIKNATLQDLQNYVDSHYKNLDKVMVCITGGGEADTVRLSVESALGKLPLIKPASAATQAKPLKPGKYEITWDIPARHLMLTWQISNYRNKSYPALLALSQWLNMKFFADTELKSQVSMTMAGADLSVPEGDFFYISASLPPEADFEKVKTIILKHVRDVDSAELSQMTPMLGVQLSFQMTQMMDMAMIKAQLPQLRQVQPGLTEAMIEGNLGLQWAMNDYRYGQGRKALAQGLSKLTASEIQAAAKFYLSEEKCFHCIIRPE